MRLDPRPLLRQAELTLGLEATDAAIAVLLGVDRRSVARWRAGGGIKYWWVADRAAVALGLHPLLLWPHGSQPASWRRSSPV